MKPGEGCGTEALQERALCVRRDIAGMPGALHDGYLFSAVSSVNDEHEGTFCCCVDR